MIEIGAEVAGLDLLAQVAVGCGDDARAAHPLLCLADALVLSVLQHAQEFGLQVKWQLADFVEE